MCAGRQLQNAVQKLRGAFLLWGVAILGAMSMGACEKISSHRVEAIVSDTKNARRDGSETLLAGETIAAGTTIQTAADGHADLALLPNLLVRLQEDSELRIINLKFSADGNETSGGVRERAALVNLVRGTAIARVEQHGYNTATLTFQTGRAKVHASGQSLFQISVRPDDTSATSIHGPLDVTYASFDQTKTLWPGQTMVIDDAGIHRIALAKAAEVRSRCDRAGTSLQFEAAAQMEARR